MRLYRIMGAAFFVLLMAGQASAADAGATIRGKVTYTDGSAVAGAKLVYRHSADPQKSQREVQTNDQGNYEFANVAAGGSDNPDDPFATGGAVRVISAPNVALTVLPPAAELELKPGDVAQRDFSLRNNITIAGKVIDTRTGEPLAAAELMASIADGPTPPVRCDDQGQFSFEAPSGSDIHIFVSNSSESAITDRGRMGYGSGSKQLKNQVADIKDLVIKVRTVPSRIVRGQAIDAAGSPVANASILTGMQFARTSADGTFQIAVVADRPTVVRAIEGVRFAMRKVTNEPEIRLQMRDPVERKCMVVCPDGTPAGDLSFSYSPGSPEDLMYGQYRSATTDARGECDLPDLIPDMAYTVTWSSDNENNRDYDSGQAWFMCKADDNGPIRFTAIRFTNSLMGKVVDENGKPVAGASIVPTGTSLMRSGAKTDISTATDGTFEVPMLGAGSIDLLIRASGFRPAYYAARTDDVDFTAVVRKTEAPFAREVAVVDESGAPLPGASVLAQLERGGAAQVLSAGPEGTFPLPASDDKTSTNILCMAPGHSPQAVSRPGKVAGIQHITMSKLQGHYAVQVEGEDGAPLSGATVRVRNLMGPGGGNGRISSGDLAWAGQQADALLMARTGADGIALFTQVGREDVAELEVTTPSGEVSVENPERGMYGMPTIRCGRPASVSGRLIAPAGAPPLAGLNVTLSGASTEFADTKADGAFEFAKMKPGDYVLQVSGGSSKLPYAMAGDQLELELQPGVSKTLEVPLKKMLVISGTLEGEPDAIADASVLVQRGDFYQYASTEDGKWEALVPEAGTYRLSYSGPTGMRNAGQVLVGEGGNMTGVVIKVKPAGGR